MATVLDVINLNQIINCRRQLNHPLLDNAKIILECHHCKKCRQLGKLMTEVTLTALNTAYIALTSLVQIAAIDALAAYGKQAIDHITEIINSPGINNQVKTHALVVLETIKKN